MADFTCALAISSAKRAPCSFEVADTMIGSVSSPAASLAKRAPMICSGATTRRIGRRCSESSPNSVVANERPPRSPSKRRALVPALPQSIGVGDARRPSRPTPRTRRTSPRRSISTPSAWSASRVRPTSCPSGSAASSLSPTAMAENKSARCAIDLSPGTFAFPSSGARAGCTRKRIANFAAGGGATGAAPRALRALSKRSSARANRSPETR